MHLLNDSKDKFNILHVAQGNPHSKDRLVNEGLETREGLGDMTQHCALSSESQPCPGLHSKQRGQQGKGGDSTPLLCPGETPLQSWIQLWGLQHPLATR